LRSGRIRWQAVQDAQAGDRRSERSVDVPLTLAQENEPLWILFDERFADRFEVCRRRHVNVGTLNPAQLSVTRDRAQRRGALHEPQLERGLAKQAPQAWLCSPLVTCE